jgi:hypothetical protein
MKWHKIHKSKSRETIPLKRHVHTETNFQIFRKVSMHQRFAFLRKKITLSRTQCTLIVLNLYAIRRVYNFLNFSPPLIYQCNSGRLSPESPVKAIKLYQTRRWFKKPSNLVHNDGNFVQQ